MKNEHITIILRPCDHCRHMLRSCHVVITQPDAIVVHQSTINIADVASGTHEVGKILIATGKRQRNPWKTANNHLPRSGSVWFNRISSFCDVVRPPYGGKQRDPLPGVSLRSPLAIELLPTPWVPVGMHVGGVHMVNRYLEESSDGSVVTPCVDRATGT